MEDYIVSLYASLAQVFEPMNLKIKMNNTTKLSDFVVP